MTKEDINTFHDHGDFISINMEPYWKPKSVARSMFFGMFLGILIGSLLTTLFFKI